MTLKIVPVVAETQRIKENKLEKHYLMAIFQKLIAQFLMQK